MGRRHKKLGRKYGFKTANIPPNKGVTYPKTHESDTAEKTVRRFDATEHDRYTLDVSGRRVNLPNTMLLRPTPPVPSASELCASTSASTSEERYFFQFLYFFFVFFCVFQYGKGG